MKGKMVNPNNISDMSIMNAKSQMAKMNLFQKIGKMKRKKEVTLSKASQKYLEQLVVEMKKQMKMYEKQMPNVFSFFNYLEKELYVDKKAKREKSKKIMLSFDEFDLLVLQLKESIKSIESEKSKLKWYSFAKKILFSTILKQTKMLLEEFK